MTTQKDIAKALGISVAAVSKALNGAPDIGEDMKEAVRKKALELGYVLNATAKALRSRKSKLVGLIYSGIEKSGLTHDFFSAVLVHSKILIMPKNLPHSLLTVRRLFLSVKKTSQRKT